jgi:hypothetical protein
VQLQPVTADVRVGRDLERIVRARGPARERNREGDEGERETANWSGDGAVY